MEWLRRVFWREDPVEDLVSAYLDAPDGPELARLEARLRDADVDVDELKSVRETSNLLRSLDTIEAPRSYALTPETLADRGYSDKQIDEILDPQSRWSGFRLRNTTVFVPLAIAALALIGVALLTIGDISDYVTDRFDSVPEGVAVQTVVVEREVEVSKSVDQGLPGEPGAPGAAGPAGEPVEERAEGFVLLDDDEILVVEKEVLVTVVVEKEVQVMAEAVVITVEVEKEVIVEHTVLIEKEVEVEVEKQVPVTVIVEVEKEVAVEVVKEVAVEVEKVVEVEKIVEVTREVAVEPAPTPAPELAAAAEESIAAATASPIPTEVPCAPQATATPTVLASPKPDATPPSTATPSLIPTCTPTPTPSPDATATPTPNP